MRRPIALAAALLAAAPGVAQAAEAPCLTPAEFTSLASYTLPSIISGTAQRCGPSLGPGAFLTTGGKDLAGRFTESGEIPNALRPIFRDRDEFTAGQALSEQTLAALDASRALIVLCSPDAAKSRYVNEETRLFKSRHPKRPVIPLIVGGKPGDPEFECFPPALKFNVDAKGRVSKKRVEVLAADAREDGDGKDLALAKVVAGLLGLSSDDIFRRAERDRRATAARRRRVQIGFGALGWLLLAGLVGWINQDYLKEQWRWFTTIRPYVMSEFRPYVLTASAEQALKLGDTLRECAKDCPEMVAIPAGIVCFDDVDDPSTARDC